MKGSLRRAGSVDRACHGLLSFALDHTFLTCLVIRVLATLCIRTYLDPDEYWQSIEPALAFMPHSVDAHSTYSLEGVYQSIDARTHGVHHDMYSTETGLTWEWWDMPQIGHSPIRSPLSALLLAWPSVLLTPIHRVLHMYIPTHPVVMMAITPIQWLGGLLGTMGTRGPVHALLPSRLWMCVIGSLADTLWGKGLDSPYLALCLSTSWFILTYTCRVYSNALEYACLGVCVYLLRDWCGDNERKRGRESVNVETGEEEEEGRGRGSVHRMMAAGAVCALGLWIRPTYGVFAIFPVLMRGLVQPFMDNVHSTFRVLYPIALGLLSALIVCAGCAWVDTLCYGHLTVTPVNFLLSNLGDGVASFYGTSGGVYYIGVCMICIMPVILAYGYYWNHEREGYIADRGTLRKYMRGRLESIDPVLWGSVAVPLVVLSLIEHKEMRFILPAIPFLYTVVLSLIQNRGGNMHGKRETEVSEFRVVEKEREKDHEEERERLTKAVSLWLVVNACMFLVINTVLQRGISIEMPSLYPGIAPNGGGISVDIAPDGVRGERETSGTIHGFQYGERGTSGTGWGVGLQGEAETAGPRVFFATPCHSFPGPHSYGTDTHSYYADTHSSYDPWDTMVDEGTLSGDPSVSHSIESTTVSHGDIVYLNCLPPPFRLIGGREGEEEEERKGEEEREYIPTEQDMFFQDPVLFFSQTFPLSAQPRLVVFFDTLCTAHPEWEGYLALRGYTPSQTLWHSLFAVSPQHGTRVHVWKLKMD
ncbi:GPI mannosyltransferase [Kipferlia bialata]|uniref:Mannosyltransferase n=1 Tax=Kipferlia bialata TaxID=797122 RepID=A0A9K3GLH2_9EUKA|nr:GPI mannosyltransferase [Kipferlia bialata]|eukprot:g8631.t1